MLSTVVKGVLASIFVIAPQYALYLIYQEQGLHSYWLWLGIAADAALLLHLTPDRKDSNG